MLGRARRRRARPHRLRLLRRQQLLGESKSPSFSGRGPITFAAAKDSSGVVQKVIDSWNKQHPEEKVTFIELPADADQQRQQMIQNAADQVGHLHAC